MALLTSIEWVEQADGRRHDEIDNAKSFSFLVGGEMIFQINTYGRDEVRAIPGKVSQTIQLNRAAARQLIAQFEATLQGVLGDPVPD